MVRGAKRILVAIIAGLALTLVAAPLATAAEYSPRSPVDFCC